MNTDSLLDMEMELQERERQDRISRMQIRGVSRTHWRECCGEIPQARQIAVRGVQYCVDCAEIMELKG